MNIKQKNLKLRSVKVSNNEVKLFYLYLKKIGYCFNKKQLNHSKFIIKAFQRRYRSKIIDGKIDKECLEIAKNLIKLGLN